MQEGLKSLEVLELMTMTASGSHCIMSALAGGATPALRDLRYRFNVTKESEGEGKALASALGSGQLRALQSLKVTGIRRRPNDLVDVAEGLKKGLCPNLLELDWRGCQLGEAEGLAIAQLLQSGSCPLLQVLNPAIPYHEGDEALEFVIEAIEEGAVPQLKSLNISGWGGSPTIAGLLGASFAIGRLEGLEKLNVSGPYWDETGYWEYDELFLVCSGCLEILDGMAAYGGPLELTHLYMSRCWMESDHGIALADVQLNDGCNNLVVLDLTENRDMGDGGLVPIMEALEGGLCQKIK